MTIQQAIERANDMKAGNAAPDEMKILWLQEIDQQIFDDVLQNHFSDYNMIIAKKLCKAGKTYEWLLVEVEEETGTEIDIESFYKVISGKTANTTIVAAINSVLSITDGSAPITQPNYNEDDYGTELLAKAPYDELYIYWLMAKIDLFAQELNKYNNSLSLFSEVYQRYVNKYKREHKSVRMPEIRVGRFW